uniref:Uncharacterized protein MANES_04G074700 n=1 Tax=Rhizophora mucronata TaxID=61149 RepID=A0A2P2PA79_RHIMU
MSIFVWWHTKSEKVMGLIQLDGGLIFGQGPLDLIADASKDGDHYVALFDTDYGELTASKLYALLSLDQVNNCSGDSDKYLFVGRFLIVLRLKNGVVLCFREEILGHIFHVDRRV